MDRQELTERTRKVVKDHYEATVGMECPEIVTETTLSDDLGFDSLDNVELILEAEEEFDIELTDDECENCLTFGSVVDMLAQKLAVPA